MFLLLSATYLWDFYRLVIHSFDPTLGLTSSRGL